MTTSHRTTTASPVSSGSFQLPWRSGPPGPGGAGLADTQTGSLTSHLAYLSRILVPHQSWGAAPFLRYEPEFQNN